ncbi:ArsC/Spx/MgsR family protein [Sphingomicrobium lutaoense]|uniref:Arsenate reductase n=1 Tax=Sphingomicrobium lutaoense TaxID=515949 RepID=A0A839YVG6_9SPHN|nr:ArsC/Spx/MgsR family protein [Sphingomicrobium lutaoense]MBB3764211.1 arsenate reductase [Sphingomicrobium lutaoense]
MKARMLFNPRCGTARKTKAILEEEGYEVEVIEYLKDTPSRAELKRMYERAGMTPAEGLRMKQPEVKELGLGPDSPADKVLDAMVAQPIIIERPLVETDKGVVLARPQDKVREIL